MSQVANNYYALAQSREDISAIIGYTWAGGIDNLQEKGVRNLPDNVIDTHIKLELAF